MPYKPRFDVMVVGPVGCGKSTLAQSLAEVLPAPCCVLDCSATLKTEATPEEQADMRAGNLLSNERANEIFCQSWREALAATRSLVLTGFPRSLEQGRDAHCCCLEPTHLFHLAIPPEVCLERLSGRLTCQSCAAVTNVAVAATHCPRCGGMLSQRPDDAPEIIRKRLELAVGVDGQGGYVAEVVEFYQKQTEVAICIIDRPLSESDLLARVRSWLDL